ncbi:septal ring lytic transglycosylase RlpA family protein [Parasphingorhabdus cellanae]|uniref:Endolytic peptidoglycan transglycosylase RlpA n=1 Tax=Parasphingorhabdus cellanae TaxID=2806553 RepID=A0ABX7T521_9SPHN|nr:septal ring lytic transglycosylase RlpA family protein [Parasphingorhabdus cellanae]QTD56231.1 septal ring lytic transglycosylase RlpA family protein [Parasphingorhabdus cellanae]
MKFAVKLFQAGLCTALLTSCGTIDGINDNAEKRIPQKSSTSKNAGISDFPIKVGSPYKIGGRTYTPEDVASYDEVGYASWYGQELSGNSTANGELFNPDGISAAHKTLPLPTYVEVTALDTGRTILVRINDRGPFANDRLIDLSHGAAKQLGIDRQGVAGVRVRKVNPNEQERSVLRNGGAATQRIDTPDSLLSILRKNLAKLPKAKAPVQQASTSMATSPINDSGVGASYVSVSRSEPISSEDRDGKFIVERAERQPVSPKKASIASAPAPSSGYIVQVAAFSNKSRADVMARKIGAKVVSDRTRTIWRVRYGPYANENDAKVGLAQTQKRGYSDARILRAN